MAWDEGVATLLRADLAGRLGGVVEKRMFGGIAFLHRGHMVAGMHKGGAMFRVGKAGQDGACALPGVRVMAMAGRPMAGMVDCVPAVAADAGVRGALLDMACACVALLPDKVAKPAKAR